MLALALGLGLVAAAPGAGPAAEAPGPDGLFRLGFSSTVFTDVNENDVIGALKVWTETIAREIAIPTDPKPVMLEGSAALGAALRSRQVDSATMNSAEYLGMDADLQSGSLVVPQFGDATTEQYVLLVHRDSAIQQVGDLAGRPLVRLDNPRAALASLWLDVLLAQNGQRPAAEFFGTVARTAKPSQAIQQVFFRKMDAAVVTRASFKLACELNPQIGQTLRELAASPEFVPQVFCYRPDYPPALRQQATAGTLRVHESPEGRQVLTVFKVDRLVELPQSCLDSVRELLAAHARLCGPTPARSAPAESVAP
jgi:phosphonate transport system substrate-binding protein